MSDTEQIDAVKQTVKDHAVIPFGAGDLAIEGDRLILHQRYQVHHGHVARRIMTKIGIHSNLVKEVYEKPSENWPVLRQALNRIGEHRQFGAIVDGDSRVVTLVEKAPLEPFHLDYDYRIDQLMESLDDAGHDLQSIAFMPREGRVRIQTVMRREVEATKDDFWKFGADVSLEYARNQFSHYFLRLVCTNGMTIREAVANLRVSQKAHLGRQFLKFAGSRRLMDAIAPRVALLQSHRASFHEVECIASVLEEEDRRTLIPWYDGIVETYGQAGHDIVKMSVKHQKMAYTDQNAYDVFNLATRLASHQVQRIGAEAAASLNKIAGEMFVKGPSLKITALDPYS